MEKLLIVSYDKSGTDLSTLTVADPNRHLPNGNLEVIKILIGSYADEIFKELTEG